MKAHKKVARFVGIQIVKWVAELFYLAGLTALIPLLPLVLSPLKFIQAKQAFVIALALIIVSFILVYAASQSKKVALRALGLFTLIPGLLAVFFSYAGQRRMAEMMGWFGQESPLFENYIETHVPKAWLLAGLYIIVGVALIWISEKVNH